MDYIYLNDGLVSAAEARVPVADRGFRFGDGVFETLRILEGMPLFWERHLERLMEGLTALHIPFEPLRATHAVYALLGTSGIQEGFLRVTVSRGSGSMGYLPTHETPPTLVVESLPMRDPPPEAVTLHVSRWKRPPLDVLPANSKLSQGVNSMLARLEAQEHGCFEALMLTTGDDVCEASSANLFWASGGVLYTPSLECGALSGTTRALIIENALMPVREGRYPLEALWKADEVFLTSVMLGCHPVRRIEPHGTEWTSHPLCQLLSEALGRVRRAYLDAARA